MRNVNIAILSLPKGNSDGKKGYLLKPGESLSFCYTPLHGKNYPVRQRLRVVGESDVFWQWRCEQKFPFHYYQSIADALESHVAPDERYALHLQATGEIWPRSAYVQAWPSQLTGKTAIFSVLAKTQGLRVAAGGDFTVEIGIYLIRQGRATGDMFDKPDITHRLKIPHGTHPWTRLAKSIRIPIDTDILLVRISGNRFYGDAWIGSPRLFQPGGDTVIPPLAPENSSWSQVNWLGENLSCAEWPKFEVSVDGKPCWQGVCFNSIVRAPDFEIPLPPLSTKCTIGLKLLNYHHATLPFVIRQAEVHEESARPVEIVVIPEYITEHQKFPVLIERNSAGRRTLDVVTIKAGCAGSAPSYMLDIGGRSEVIRPKRVVQHGDDGITLSTGDAVYVPQNLDDFLRYIEWYVANRIGNAICFRPVYRWCGSRIVQAETWKATIRILNKLGMKYNLMVDGRELPGMNANPPDHLIAGPNYMGRQAHEQDGAFYYWRGNQENNTLFIDIFFRSKDNGGIFPAVRPPVRNGNSIARYFDNQRVTNMREGADYFIQNLKLGKGLSTRHTGPSTLFRYFFQAGYDWIGAEQMYSAEEIVLSAARGATAAYRKKEFGAHLAVQWSSHPHDTQAHANRYFLALATCYMQGVGNINTEEGLYRMESEYADHDRFSNACEIHREANTKIRRFMETHTRRGTIRVPIAVLQGRYCAWRCFGRGPAWSSTKPEFAFGPPEESFDLLKVFFPRSVLDGIYVNPCSDDRPFGWYTGTPFGPIDLLPVEAPLDVLARYRAAVFLGWNTFDELEFQKLLDFVKGGGTLLLARPHLSTEVRRQQPAIIPDTKLLNALLGKNWKKSRGRHEQSVGYGTVIYYGDDLYPSAKPIRKAYERDLAAIGKSAAKAEQDRGWIVGGEDVSFTAFDWPDGKTRTIYLLNTDWWSGQRIHVAKLLLGSRQFDIPVHFGNIHTLVICNGVAAMAEAPDAEITAIEFKEGFPILSIQSDFGTRLSVFFRNDAKPVTVKTTKSGICTLRLTKRHTK